MPLLNRHGVHIYYEVHGSGRPLVLTHGFAMTSAVWQEQVQALSQDFKVITWDMRGHGRSDYPDDASAYSQAHTVGDIGALIDETCGHGTIAIVGGLSLGGYMSLAFCRAFPSRVAALLLVSAGPGFKSDAARARWNGKAVRVADAYAQTGLAALPSDRRRFREAHRNARGLALAARGMLAQQNPVVINALPTIKAPCLLLVGADDPDTQPAADYMARKMLQAKKVAVEGAGHVVNVDRPDDFLRTVQPFLRKWGSPRSTL